MKGLKKMFKKNITYFLNSYKSPIHNEFWIQNLSYLKTKNHKIIAKSVWEHCTFSGTKKNHTILRILYDHISKTNNLINWYFIRFRTLRNFLYQKPNFWILLTKNDSNVLLAFHIAMVEYHLYLFNILQFPFVHWSVIIIYTRCVSWLPLPAEYI